MNVSEGCAKSDPLAIRQVKLITIVTLDKRVKDQPEGVQACPELRCLGCQGGYDLHDALVAEIFG